MPKARQGVVGLRKFDVAPAAGPATLLGCQYFGMDDRRGGLGGTCAHGPETKLLQALDVE